MNFDLMQSIERPMGEMKISVFCRLTYFGISQRMVGAVAACSGTSGTSLVPFYFESSKYFCII